MPVAVNSVWELPEEIGVEPGQYRILAAYADVFIIFNVRETRNIVRPSIFPIEEFQGHVARQTIIPCESNISVHMLFDEATLSKESARLLEERWQLVAPLVDDNNLLISLATQSHQPKVVQRGRETQTRTNTIYRLLNRYWRYGQTRHALIPDYHLCGAPGLQRLNVSQSLGRKVVSRTGAFASRSSYIVSEQDKNNIKAAVKKYHLKTGGMGLAETRRNFLREFFPKELADADFHDMVPNAPTLRQFRYWVSKLFDKHQLIKDRKHDTDYQNNFRGNESSAVSNNLVPGACFEIDATVMDVHIVSKLNRNKVLGRPTLYFVIDRASGMTVGLSISLFYASWDAARLAIYNAFTSKVDYCRCYGIDITEKDWPCAHIPNRLIADNAEMLGLEAEASVVPMVPLEWAPISRPDYKPFVEGSFHTLNKTALHRLQGATRDNGKIIKHAPDPRTRAIHTIEELTTIVLRSVLDKNQTIQERLGSQSKLMVETDSRITPLSYWHTHVTHYLSALKKASAEEIEARLLRPVKVSMTEHGIYFEQLYYSHKKVREQKFAAIAKSHGRISMEARVNDDCLDFIFVKLPGDKTFTRCTLLKRSMEMSGSSLIDIYYLQDWVDNQLAKGPVPISSIETLSINKAIVRQAKSEAKKAPKPKTKRARTDGIRENRVSEMKRQLETSKAQQRLSDKKPEPIEQPKKRAYSYNVITLPTREDKS